ncbi:hypothetical protein B0H14DRAFT_3131122 [Mycena olivaceomarginata]|nr:hypothetical protein B0H14DRAFT_3131122 [Mycena olivaceomarginata]
MECESFEYLNRDQRNVHLWASMLTRSRQLSIIAGCYNEMVRVCDVYEWLGRIVDMIAPRFALFRLDQPPRVQTLNAVVASVATHTRPLNSTSTNKIPAGDYIVLLVVNNQYAPGLPNLKPIIIKSRSTSNNGTPGTAKDRDQSLRPKIRYRDRSCRATRTEAPMRDRGPNWKGFEVAHIYPLGSIALASKFLDAQTLRSVASRSIADRPHNALLLTSVAHEYFDDYQFGFAQDAVNHMQWRLVVLEKDGAPTISRQLTFLAPAENASDPTVDIKSIIFGIVGKSAKVEHEL